MAYEINDLKGFLLMILLSLPGVALTNIDCHGKPFHCINSTHFIICVDMGGGVTTTIDNFMIPCPQTTVCHETNRYECEFPPSDPKPPIEVIGISNASDNSFSSSVTNSATTTKPSNILLLDTTTNINATEEANLKKHPKFEVPDKLKVQPDTPIIMGDTNHINKLNDSKREANLTNITESSRNQSVAIHSTTETYRETTLAGSSTSASGASSIDTLRFTTSTESNFNPSNLENISSNVPPDIISSSGTSTITEVSYVTTTTIADLGILNYNEVNNTQNDLATTTRSLSFSTTETTPNTNDSNNKSSNSTTPLSIVRSINIADNNNTEPHQNISSTKGYNNKQLNNITIDPVLSMNSSNISKSERNKTYNPETSFNETTLDDKYNFTASSNTPLNFSFESQSINTANRNKSKLVDSNNTIVLIYDIKDNNSPLTSDRENKLNGESLQPNLTTISTTDRPTYTTLESFTETSGYLDSKNESENSTLAMPLTTNSMDLNIQVEHTTDNSAVNSIGLDATVSQNPYNYNKSENGNLEMALSNTTQPNIIITNTSSNAFSYDAKLNNSVFEKNNQGLNNSILDTVYQSFNIISESHSKDSDNFTNNTITTGALPSKYNISFTETIFYTQIENNTNRDKNINHKGIANSTYIVNTKEKTKDSQVELETPEGEIMNNLTGIPTNENINSSLKLDYNTNYILLTNKTNMFDSSTDNTNISIKLDSTDNVTTPDALILKQNHTINVTKQDATNQSLNLGVSKIQNSKIPLYEISKHLNFSDVSVPNNGSVVTSENNNSQHLASLMVGANFTSVVNKTVTFSLQDNLSMQIERNLTTQGGFFTFDTSKTTNNTSLPNQAVINDQISNNNASDLSILNKKVPNATNTTRASENNTKLSTIQDGKQTTGAPLLKTHYKIDAFLSVSMPSTNILLSNTVKYHTNSSSNQNQNQSENLVVPMKTKQSDLSTVTENVTLKPHKEATTPLTRSTSAQTTDRSFVTQKAMLHATTREWTTTNEQYTKETSTIEVIESITKLSTMEEQEKQTTVAPVKATNQIQDIPTVSSFSSYLLPPSTVKYHTNANSNQTKVENLVVTTKTIQSDLSTVTAKIDTIPVTPKPHKETTVALTGGKSASSIDTSVVTKKPAQATSSDLTIINKEGSKDMTNKEKQTETGAPVKTTYQIQDILSVSIPFTTILPSSTVKYDTNTYSNQNQLENLVVTTQTIKSELFTVTAKIETLPVTLKPHTAYSTSEKTPSISTTISTHTNIVTQKAVTQETQQNFLKITPNETRPNQQVQYNNTDTSTVLHGKINLTTVPQNNIQTTKIPSEMTSKMKDTNLLLTTGISTQINKPESLKSVTQSFAIQTQKSKSITMNDNIKFNTEKYLYPTQLNTDIHYDGIINNTTTLVDENLKVNTNTVNNAKTLSVNQSVSQYTKGDKAIIILLNDTNSIAKIQSDLLNLKTLKENADSNKMPETLTTVEPNSMIETIINQNKTSTAHLSDLVLSEGMFAKVTSKSSTKNETPKISTDSHEIKETKNINKNIVEQFFPENLEVQSTTNHNLKLNAVSETSATKQPKKVKPYVSFDNTSVNNLQGIPIANITAKQSNISSSTVSINQKNIRISHSNKTNPNKSKTASVFDCSNRSRGRYADNNDCRNFYICIGNHQPITGFCPNNTVFSAIYKHCTKNLSHCVRNKQFRCLREGRFSDFFQDNVYYVCVKTSDDAFLRFKLQCQKDHQLNKTTMKCQKIVDMSSQSFSSVSEQVSNNRNIPKKSPETVANVSFVCPKEGRFLYETDSRKYYECKKSSKGEYRQRLRKCDCDEIFSEKKEKCVDSESNGC